MAVIGFSDWLSDFDFTRPEIVWYVKRLSANDTQENHSHQAGPYIKRDLLLSLFPSLDHPRVINPDIYFELYIDSHNQHRNVRAVWYNNKFRGGTRNETRLTQLSGSAFLDPDNMGTLTIFAFVQTKTGVVKETRAWVCRTQTEENQFENKFRPLELGRPRIFY